MACALASSINASSEKRLIATHYNIVQKLSLCFIGKSYTMSHHQPQAPENGNATNVSVEKTQHEMSNTVVDAEMTPLVRDEEKMTLAMEL